jgi:hypothetical protein
MPTDYSINAEATVAALGLAALWVLAACVLVGIGVWSLVAWLAAKRDHHP